MTWRRGGAHSSVPRNRTAMLPAPLPMALTMALMESASGKPRPRTLTLLTRLIPLRLIVSEARTDPLTLLAVSEAGRLEAPARVVVPATLSASAPLTVTSDSVSSSVSLPGPDPVLRRSEGRTGVSGARRSGVSGMRRSGVSGRKTGTSDGWMGSSGAGGSDATWPV